MSKRILSLVLTLALVLGSFSMAFADTTATTTNTAVTPEQKIAELQRLGFIKGDDSGDLKLQDPIKRSETAIIVSKAVVSGGDKDMAAVEAEIELSRYQSRFSDVPTSYRSNPYINVAVQKAIVNGYPDNTFRPDRDIKYSEVITMMVNILGEKPTAGVKYPDNYIGKARELGLLEGINVNYVGQAQRQGVFELLYNTITSNKVGNYNIDKVLVLENNRVESIGANELVVEVIKEVQRANFVNDSRNEGDKDARRGQQLRITVPSEVGDVEDLLGKVVDLSYDSKNVNKAVAIKVDNTYEYKSGEITLEEKKLEIDEKTYTVSKDERYSTYNDERIFNTYINNESFSYEDALKESKKNNKSLDFANVTIKNGKVLFIDAFAFNEIAPVKEVKENGNKTEVTVYNDMNDGGTKKIELEKEKVISFEKGSFRQMDKKDINALDVIHVGEDSKENRVVLVRKDAQVNGKYEKVVEYSKDNKVVIVVDGEEYKILTADAKKPVYAYDSKEFRTLKANEASNVLKEFKDEKVTILRDVNGNLQYLGSEIAFGEFVSLVDRIVGKEVRVLKADNTKSDFSTTLDSKLGSSSTGHQSLQAYYKGDLVFVSANKDQIDRMSLLRTNNELKINSTESKDVSSLSRDFIKLTNGNDFKVLERTNVFVKEEGKTPYATTMKYVVDNYSKDVAVQAVVVTDKNYKDLAIEVRKDFDGRSDIANTIVFTKISLKADLDKQKAEITSVSNKFEEIEVRLPNGSGTSTYKILKDSDAFKALERKDVRVGDIVELRTDKADKKVVHEIELLSNRVAGKVYSYNDRTKVLNLYNDSTDYFLTAELANFVKGSIEKDKNVTLYLEKSGSKYVVAIADGNKDVIESTKDVITKITTADGKTILTINGRLYQYAGSVSDVAGFLDEKVTFKIQTLNGVEYVYDLNKVNQEKPNKASLIQAIVNAKAPSTTAGKTAESVKVLTDAITAAEAVRDNANATQTQVDAAVVVINNAIAGLVDEVATPGKVINGKLEAGMFGPELTFDVTDGTKITLITLEGKTLSAANFDYGVTANTVTVMDVKSGDKVLVTVDGTEYSVKF